MTSSARGRTEQPSPMRRFDPRRLAGLECDTWIAYYQRNWLRVLLAAVGMVRVGFRMSWPRLRHARSQKARTRARVQVPNLIGDRHVPAPWLSLGCPSAVPRLSPGCP